MPAMPDTPDAAHVPERSPGDAGPGRPASAAASLASVQWRAILSRFGHGNDSALVELIEQEGPRLLRRIEAALPARVRVRVGASDIFQQTLMDLAQAQDQFDNRGPAAFRKLVNTMAESRVAQAIRRERARKRDVLREVHAPQGFGDESVAGPIVEQVAGDTPQPSQLVRQQESAEHLRTALAQLSESDRQVLRLVDYEELDHATVAARLGITAKAVQKRHSRALERLRELLRDPGRSSGD